jgi:hypothetical protein
LSMSSDAADNMIQQLLACDDFEDIATLRVSIYIIQ